MERLLPIVMIVAGAILVIGSLAFIGDAEIRQWLIVFLIGGGVLVFWSIKKYRDA